MRIGKSRSWGGRAAAVLVAFGMLGCGGGTGSEGGSGQPGAIRIDMESARADQLLSFYFGSYLGKEGGDPVAAGLLEKRENSWFLRNPDGISEAHPVLRLLYDRFQDSGRLTADSLETFLEVTYYAARRFPQTLEQLKEDSGAWVEPEWFAVEVQGSMVSLPRRTWVRREAIRSALEGMETLDDPVLYPVGTLFVGEHLDQDHVVETSVMQKRADGYWDYWAYDADGNLTTRIRKEPRDLVVPTRCTGCHYGDRAFEPERSFPGDARPGPAGPREIRVPPDWRNADLTSRLDEHARRSDTILGLYATLYLAQAAAGQGDAEAVAQLARFGIERRTP